MQSQTVVSTALFEDTDEENLLRQMVEVIVRERSPEAIILFGSRARGMPAPTLTWICW